MLYFDSLLSWIFIDIIELLDLKRCGQIREIL